MPFFPQHNPSVAMFQVDDVDDVDEVGGDCGEHLMRLGGNFG